MSVHNVYSISLIGLQVTLIDVVVVGITGHEDSAVRHLRRYRDGFFNISKCFLGLVVKDDGKLHLPLITLGLLLLLLI